MIGTVLAGRYELEAQIGSGGMGAVYRAIDRRTGGVVAIKLPHPWLSGDAAFVARLRREAQIAASVHSPRVVGVIDFDQHEGQPFLVMEFVPGETLDELLQRRGPFPPDEAATIAIEVARALDAAHARGIVHRDLKPQNIKLDDGDVKVLDFGIARAEGQAAVTSASVLVGTPEYIAPERLNEADSDAVAAGMPSGDIRSDIYALGIILYEMLTGVPPFTGATPWAVLKAHEQKLPPPLPATVSDALAAVVSRCLEKRPEDRYATPRDLVAALGAVTGSGPITASPTPRPATAPPLSPPAPPAMSAAATSPGGATVPAASVSSSDGAAPTRKSPAGNTPLIAAVVTGVLLAVAVVALLMIVNRDGGDPARASISVTAPAPLTAQSAASTASTVASAAAGARVTDIRLFRSPADEQAGQSATEFAAGVTPRICYRFADADETALTVVMMTVGGQPIGRSEPFLVLGRQGRRCETPAIASGLAAGSYVVEVQDGKGQVAGRQPFTVR